MTISPYENFNDWSFILLNALECSHQYGDMLQDCVDLIFSILSDNQLPEPINQFTNNFLYELIPRATFLILKVTPVDEDEIESGVGFLTTVLSLCTWSIQNNISNLVKIPSDILNRYQFFYKTPQIWTGIKDLYLSSGDLNSIVEMMMNTNPFPSLAIFQYVINIINTFQGNSMNEQEIPVKQFTEAFGNYLKSIMTEPAIRVADKSTINVILGSFYRVLGNFHYEFEYDLTNYFEFFEFCLKCEILPIQLFAVDSIREFLTYSSNEIAVIFFSWLISSNLLNSLIEKNLNVEIINKIDFIFEKLAFMNFFPESTLFTLWDRILHVHSSLRQPYITIISKSMQYLDISKSHQFFDQILLGHPFEPQQEESHEEVTNDNSIGDEIDPHENSNLNSYIDEAPLEKPRMKIDVKHIMAKDNHALDIKPHVEKDNESLTGIGANEKAIEKSIIKPSIEKNNDLDKLTLMPNIEEVHDNSKLKEKIEDFKKMNPNKLHDDNDVELIEEEEYDDSSNCDDNIHLIEKWNLPDVQAESDIPPKTQSRIPKEARQEDYDLFDLEKPVSADIESQYSEANLPDSQPIAPDQFDEPFDDWDKCSPKIDIPPLPIPQSTKYQPYFTNEYVSEMKFPISNDILALLLTTIKFAHSNLSMDLFSLLFDASMIDSTILIEFSRTLSQQFTYPFASKQLLFKKCFSCIREHPDNHKTATILLPKLINQGYLNQSEEFENAMLDTLRFDKPLMYSLLLKYYLNAKNVINMKKVMEIYQTPNDLDDGFWTLCKSLLDNNACYAFDQNGFDQLETSIQEFDFTKATPAFIDFLQSYYLTMSMYYNKLDTNNYTDLRQRLLYFLPGNAPEGLEQLFEIIEVSSNQVVITKTTNLLVTFLTQYKNYSSANAIDTIKLYVLPKIVANENKNNFVLIERYLTILYQICNISEMNLNLSDFGLPHHSIYKENVIYLTIYNTLMKQILIRPPKQLTLKQIELELHKLYPELTKIHFSYQNGTNSLFKSQYENDMITELIPIKNNKGSLKLVTYASLQSLSKIQMPDCPSKYLTEIRFQQRLLELTKQHGLKEIINRILDYLPNDPELWDDSDQFQQLIAQNEEFEPIIQYYLQKLIFQLQYDDLSIQKFQSIDFCSHLIDIYKKHQICYGEILIILKLLFCDELAPISDSIILIVSRILTDRQCLMQYKEMASQFFLKLLERFPQTNIFTQNPILFESLVLTASNSTWNSIQNGLNALENVGPLFDIILNHIGQDSKQNYAYFANLFARFVPKVSKERNIAEIFKKSLDLILSFDFRNEKVDKSLFISLCEVATSILDSNQIDRNEFEFKASLEKLLSNATENEDEEIQNAIYNLCFSLAKYIPNGNQLLQELTKPFYQITTDSWNYLPSNYKKSSTGFVGLRNLGATCYMNSILQQLFFNMEFRKSLFIETFESQKEESRGQYIELQTLFAYLSLSKKSVVDTLPFCQTWKGWNNQVINVRQQEDVVEFWNLFLDQLPETLQKFYKGTIINRIEGITEEFTSHNIETFFSIPIEIQHFTTMDESFDAFLQDERFTGENQIMADALGHKIDAKKYSRIQNAPTFLVIQLKRFEYDLYTSNRYKIQSRFVIPQEINIKKLMENNEDKLYKLKGVVLHSGNANLGHYTSLIQIDGNWYNFNDAQVTDFDFRSFEEVAFGGDPTKSSAYLLVYEMQNKINENLDLLSKSDEELINPKIKEEVELCNDQFMKCQTMFTRPTLHFVSYSNNLEIMTNYFINIFIHSALGDEYHIITTRLLNCIDDSSKIEWFFKYTIEHISKIQEFYKECSNESIHQSFIELFCDILALDYFNLNSLILLCDLSASLVEYSLLLPNYKSYQYIYRIPLLLLKYFNLNSLMNENEIKYCTIGNKDNLSKINDLNIEAIKKHLDLSNWLILIQKVINVFYETRPIVACEQVNFTDLFRLAKRICPIGQDSSLINYSSKILLPETHFMSFLSFAVLTKQSKFDLEDGFARFYSELRNGTFLPVSINEKYYHYVSLLISHTDYNVAQSVYQSFDRNAIYNLFTRFLKEVGDKKNHLLRSKLIEKFSDYIIPIMTSPFTKTRSAQLLDLLFPEVAPFPTFSFYTKFVTESKKYEIPDVVFKKMQFVLMQLMQFISTMTLAAFKAYFTDQSKPANANQEFTPDNDPLLQLLGITKHLLTTTNNFEKNYFDIFLSFYANYNEIENKCASKFYLICEILLSFPGEFTKGHEAALIKHLFEESKTRPTLNESIIFRLSKLSSDQVYAVFSDEENLAAFASIVKDHFPSYKSKICIVLDNLLLQKDPSMVNHFAESLTDFDIQRQNCIYLVLLKTPVGILKDEYINGLALAIINHLVSKIQYYSSICNEDFYQLVTMITLHLQKSISTFDFDFLDDKIIDSLIACSDRYQRDSIASGVIDLFELLCVNDRVRHAFYNFKYMPRLINSYIFEENKPKFLKLFLKLTEKHKNELKSNVELIVNSLPRRITLSLETISKFDPNILDLFIESKDSEICQIVVKYIFIHFDLCVETEVGVDYYKKLLLDIGENDAFQVMNSIQVNDFPFSYPNSLRRWVDNMAISCEVYPSFVNAFKDNKNVLFYRDKSSLLSSSAREIFYPTQIPKVVLPTNENEKGELSTKNSQNMDKPTNENENDEPSTKYSQNMDKPTNENENDELLTKNSQNMDLPSNENDEPSTKNNQNMDKPTNENENDELSTKNSQNMDLATTQANENIDLSTSNNEITNLTTNAKTVFAINKTKLVSPNPDEGNAIEQAFSPEVDALLESAGGNH